MRACDGSARFCVTPRFVSWPPPRTTRSALRVRATSRITGTGLPAAASMKPRMPYCSTRATASVRDFHCQSCMSGVIRAGREPAVSASRRVASASLPSAGCHTCLCQPGTSSSVGTSNLPTRPLAPIASIGVNPACSSAESSRLTRRPRPRVRAGRGMTIMFLCTPRDGFRALLSGVGRRVRTHGHGAPCRCSRGAKSRASRREGSAAPCLSSALGFPWFGRRLGTSRPLWLP